MLNKLSQGEREALVVENREFVPFVVRKYFALRGVDRDLLESAGYEGLWEAATRWDPEYISPKTGKPVRFISYARWWVDARIREAIQQWHKYPLEDSKPEPCPECKHKIDKDPNCPLCKGKGVTETRTTTINKTVQLQLFAEQQELPNHDEFEDVAAYILQLPKKQRLVMNLRLGLYDDIPRTLKETGKILGHSREWARQQELKAKAHLLDLIS